MTTGGTAARTALAMLALGCVARREPAARGTTAMEIEYWSNAYSEARPVVLRLAGRSARLELGSNGVQPNVTRVGVAQAELNDADVVPLRDELSSSAFAGLRDPEPVPPGEVVRRITVRADGGRPVTKHATAGVPTDEAFLAPERRLLGLVQALGRRMTHGFSIGLDLGVNASAESLQVPVVISNVGSEVVRLPHPSRWADAGIKLTLSIVPKAGTPGDQPLGGQQFVDLGARGLTDAQPPLTSEPSVAIAPGKAVVLTFRSTVRLAAGEYEFQLTFDAPLLDALGDELLRCEVFSTPRATRVRPA
jgi:hypothetical protein